MTFDQRLKRTSQLKAMRKNVPSTVQCVVVGVGQDGWIWNAW